ncbi:MAG: AAA family ATPase [Thermoplasmata archaeon]
MTTILLTGMPGAGKEEFLNVARKEGYDIIRMGDVVREHAEQKGISFEDQNLGSFAQDERERHHEGIWADRTLCDITEDKTVIDGVRSREEVSIFKSDLGDLHIVAIHASPNTRFERLKERGREDAPQTWSEFNDRDNRELDWGLGRVIARADHMIINESSLKDFYSKVRELLKQFD